MATAKAEVSLKLLIDTSCHKVLFAEADKHFVDFLFNLLSLPVGTVIKLLTKQSMVGSLGKLYDSIENLSETYIQPNQTKSTILNPKISSAPQLPLMLTRGESAADKEFFMCSSFHRHVADDPSAICPECKNVMYQPLPFVEKPKDKNFGEGGFVKGVVTYMVMDDLEVKPMSTISSLTLLNKFQVKEVGGLKEKVVKLGMDEGLKLLKASLSSRMVLTTVFFGNKGI